MTQEDFANAYILLFSGAAQMKNAKEMWWKDKDGTDTTIEFPNLTPDFAIVRTYYFLNRGLSSEYKYENGKLNGKCFLWYDNGQKNTELEYKNGERNGKWLRWYENGNKEWEDEYADDMPNGKSISWYNDGKKSCEKEYVNGLFHGSVSYWYEDGKLEKEEYEYGREICYDENGNKYLDEKHLNGIPIDNYTNIKKINEMIEKAKKNNGTI